MSDNSRNRRQEKFTDQIEDGYLHIHKIIQKEEKTTYILKWTIRNYRKLSYGISHYAHHIRIGKSQHRFRILKHDTKLNVPTTPQKLVYIFLGLTPSPAFAKVSISILGSDKKETFPQENLDSLYANMVHRKSYSGFRETLNFVYDFYDTMNVVYKITVNKNVTVDIDRGNSILADLGDLFNYGKFSDITIHVGTEKFQAHRAILGARSPVFEAMLQCEMMEKRENRLEIHDCDAETFVELLRYLYTGKVNPLTTNLALNLLQLADKYDVQKLKSEMEDYLQSNLSTEYVLHILSVADMLNSRTLKREAIYFIEAHLQEIIHSEEWKSFRNSLDLVDDILRCMC